MQPLPDYLDHLKVQATVCELRIRGPVSVITLPKGYFWIQIRTYTVTVIEPCNCDRGLLASSYCVKNLQELNYRQDGACLGQFRTCLYSKTPS